MATKLGILAWDAARTLSTVAVVFLAGCAGNLPEPASVAQGTNRHISDLEVPAAGASNQPETDAVRYIRHRIAAQNYCSERGNQLTGFAGQVTRSAQKRTLWGAVVTAGLGGAGGIATAVSASSQSVNSGGTINGQSGTTVLGAVTAGVTLLGTALTLAVIGPPPSDTLAAIDKADGKMLADWQAFSTACPIAPTTAVSGEWYTQCTVQADGVPATCASELLAVQLKAPPYQPPPDPPIAATPLVPSPAPAPGVSPQPTHS